MEELQRLESSVLVMVCEALACGDPARCGQVSVLGRGTVDGVEVVCGEILGWTHCPQLGWEAPTACLGNVQSWFWWEV